MWSLIVGRSQLSNEQKENAQLSDIMITWSKFYYGDGLRLGVICTVTHRVDGLDVGKIFVFGF